MEVSFCQPFIPDTASIYISDAVRRGNLAGDFGFTKQCHQWLSHHTSAKKALLTTSGTHALEMAALLADLKTGDEVIMPSFTFSSTANAFVLRGARLVFIDVRPDTMNLDEKLIEEAITPRTRAIVVMHYGGVCCEMDQILDIARRHNLLVIEDAAQAIMSRYRGRPAGTLGDMGCFSFHQTKNFTCGEGGALVLRESKFSDRAEIVREKGTNRSQFFRGQVDKYTWLDVGSSYLPSDLNAAILWSQLEMADAINRERMRVCDFYREAFTDLEKQGLVETQTIPSDCESNGHLFYLKVRDLKTRTDLIAMTASQKVGTPFHYVPLHSSPAGRRFGRFHGIDRYTTVESERLLRLPVNYGMNGSQLGFVSDLIHQFFKSAR